MKRYKTTLFTAAVVYIEWIDFVLYMYLGTSISKYFFPDNIGSSAIILTYVIFAISYISRPIGGLIFGVYSDVKGRKKPLIISAMLMALATIGIGLIPSYEMIGVWAPILLLICRLIKSMAVAGEFNNSSIFLMEHAKSKKTLAGSWIGVASSAGMFTGSVIAYIVSTVSYTNSWQIAFILVGISSLVIMVFRQSLKESPEFIVYTENKNTNKKKVSMYSSFMSQKDGLLKIAIIASFLCVYIYICNIYFSNYMHTHMHYETVYSMSYMMFVQGFVTLFIPLFAFLAEKVGYEKVLRRAIPMIGVMAFLLYTGGKFQSYDLIILGLICYVFANAAISATIFRYMYECLSIEFRCTGGSFMYSLTAAIFGGTAPIIAAYFIESGHLMAPAYYVLIFTVVAYLSVTGVFTRYFFKQKYR